MTDRVKRALKRIEGLISARQLKDPRDKIIAGEKIGTDEMILRTIFNVRDDLEAALRKDDTVMVFFDEAGTFDLSDIPEVGSDWFKRAKVTRPGDPDHPGRPSGTTKRTAS